MDVMHPKVKYHWFISLAEQSGEEQKKVLNIIKNLPKLVKISKKGLIFESPLSPEFLKLLRLGPSSIYLRILFKLQGHANWKSFDIKKLWPASMDVSSWSVKNTGDTEAFGMIKELFFNLEEGPSKDFSVTFDQSKF